MRNVDKWRREASIAGEAATRAEARIAELEADLEQIANNYHAANSFAKDLMSERDDLAAQLARVTEERDKIAALYESEDKRLDEEMSKLEAQLAVAVEALEDLRDTYEETAFAAARDVGADNRDHARNVMAVVEPALAALGETP